MGGDNPLGGHNRSLVSFLTWDDKRLIKMTIPEVMTPVYFHINNKRYRNQNSIEQVFSYKSLFLPLSYHYYAFLQLMNKRRGLLRGQQLVFIYLTRLVLISDLRSGSIVWGRRIHRLSLQMGKTSVLGMTLKNLLVRLQ